MPTAGRAYTVVGARHTDATNMVVNIALCTRDRLGNTRTLDATLSTASGETVPSACGTSGHRAARDEKYWTATSGEASIPAALKVSCNSSTI